MRKCPWRGCSACVLSPSAWPCRRLPRTCTVACSVLQLQAFFALGGGILITSKSAQVQVSAMARPPGRRTVHVEFASFQQQVQKKNLHRSVLSWRLIGSGGGRHKGYQHGQRNTGGRRQETEETNPQSKALSVRNNRGCRKKAGEGARVNAAGTGNKHQKTGPGANSSPGAAALEVRRNLDVQRRRAPPELALIRLAAGAPAAAQEPAPARLHSWGMRLALGSVHGGAMQAGLGAEMR